MSIVKKEYCVNVVPPLPPSLSVSEGSTPLCLLVSPGALIRR